MRSLLILFLVVFFAGVRVLPVIGVAQADTGAVEQTVSPGHAHDHDSEHGIGQPVSSAMSHFMECCEHLVDTGSGEKASGCSADCASTLVEVDFLISIDPASREAVPLPAFAAPKVYLRDHPPKPV